MNLGIVVTRWFTTVLPQLFQRENPTDAAQLEESLLSNESDAPVDDSALTSLATLPSEVALLVFSYLDCHQVVNLGSTCRALYDLSYDQFLWLGLFKQEWPYDSIPSVPSDPKGAKFPFGQSTQSSLARQLYASKKLKETEASERRYKELETALKGDCKLVYSLQLKDDRLLRKLPEAIKELPLTNLSVIYTRFKVFPDALTSITTLRELNIGFNLISSIPKAIGQLTNLTKLSLNNNLITELPPDIGNLEKLIVLEVFYNRIASLPPEVGRLTRLEQLAAQHNRLQEITPELGNCTHLQTVDLSNNQLTELPEQLLTHFNNLRSLSLAGNRLASLPELLGASSSLRELNLYDNRLEFVPPSLEALASSESLCTIFIDENPFTRASASDPLNRAHILSSIRDRNRKILERRREMQNMGLH